MREVFSEIEAWLKAGKPVAIATNVKRGGSSLRPLGAKMAVTTAREIAGSVTGGCIEGVVYDEAQGVIKSGQPKLLHYGVASKETPWEVGLTCGGYLDVFVETLNSPAWQEIYPVLKTCILENQMAAVATIISGSGLGKKILFCQDGRTFGSLGSEELTSQVLIWMQNQISIQETNWAAFQSAGEKIEVFVDVISPGVRLVIIGAVHIAMPLVTLAKSLGYYTIVIDPRSAFATHERFPHVDELITEWPSTALENLDINENTYIAALSHDEKLDNPALAVALKSPARYVGVLGGRKSIPKRLAVLHEMGVDDEQIQRLRAPIGIHLGEIEPDEIALSILAEIVSTRHGLPKTQ